MSPNSLTLQNHLPSEPKPAPLLEPVLRSAVSLGPDGWFADVAGIPPLSFRAITAAEHHAEALARYLAPGDPEAVALRLTVLLAHWRAPEMDEETGAMVAADWVRFIGRYPLFAIEAAADEWLLTEDRRPTIAGIRRICDRFTSKHAAQLRALRLLIGRDAP